MRHQLPVLDGTSIRGNSYTNPYSVLGFKPRVHRKPIFNIKTKKKKLAVEKERQAFEMVLNSLKVAGGIAQIPLKDKG